MIFADIFSDFIGQACLMFVVILLAIGWIVQKVGEAAGNALKNDTVKEAARIGFWTWWFSSDD